MEVQQRIIAEGVDSWEAELTCQGITFQVEAHIEGKSDLWYLEVLRYRSRRALQPVHHGSYATLEAAIQGARIAIQQVASSR